MARENITQEMKKVRKTMEERARVMERHGKLLAKTNDPDEVADLRTKIQEQARKMQTDGTELRRMKRETAAND